VERKRRLISSAGCVAGDSMTKSTKRLNRRIVTATRKLLVGTSGQGRLGRHPRATA
jgi:hypothetical protein